MSATDADMEPHIAAAVAKMVEQQHGAEGEYVIVIDVKAAPDGIVYTWKWLWSPAVPKHIGRVT